MKTFKSGTFLWNLAEPGSRFRAAAPNHPEALLEEPHAFQTVGENNRRLRKSRLRFGLGLCVYVSTPVPKRALAVSNFQLPGCPKKAMPHLHAPAVRTYSELYKCVPPEGSGSCRYFCRYIMECSKNTFC